MNDVGAKKALGQHWLDDETVLNAMCDAVEVGPGDIVLEIGPGKGSLTKKLAERATRVIAVEFDELLATELPYRVPAENLEVRQADILNFDPSELPKGYKIVANIPYYLTSNLIRRLCESQNPFSVAALLVQQEVAERICAAPGQTSLLSISTQLYCHVELGGVVPARLFTPPPKVDSRILVLKYREEPLFKDLDKKKFFRLVKAGFSERRKKLRSSISGGLRLNKAEADLILARAGINGDLRAQNLSLEQWYKLYKSLN